MNKSLKFITRTVFGMFLVLFFSLTMVQFVTADELRSHELNGRTVKNGYKVERGSLLVEGNPIAYSTPTDDEFRFERQYPEGPLYAPVTGYFSHTQGMTGLESAMNQELTGTGDAQFFSRTMRTLTGEKPQGSSVETTIDAAAQEAAADAMSGFEGAVVAMEPGTGRLLAMYSTPSFDPGDLSSNNDGEIIANYRQLEEDPAQPLLNRATGGDLYHPGSSYKLLTAAAAIEAGEADPDTEFDNDSELTLPQSTAVMRNASRGKCGPGDEVSLERTMILSCNIPIAQLAMGMDRDAVPNMAREFGFGQEVEIPFATTPSQAPTPEDDAQVALSSIGQLDVRATPLQMAMVSAGIANDGVVMQPQLVEQVITPDLRVEQDFSPEQFSNPISSETANTMTEIMEQVVSAPDGTARIAGLDDVDVAGKTGTAENGTDENGNDLPFTLWFTGFAPVEDPQVAVAVVIADGGGEAYDFQGGSSELPTAVSRQVMEAVLSE